MKDYLKRLIVGILALAIICAIVPAQRTKAAEEVISVNRAYSYELTKDAKILKFTAPEDGVFTVDAVITSDDSKQLEVNLLDSNGNQLIDPCYGRSVFEKVSTTEYATRGGRYFYIKLSIPNLTGVTKDVTLTVNFTASNEWENEGNNTAEEACALENGAVKYGVLTKEETEDFFAVKVTENSKVTIEFGPKTVTGDYDNWVVDLIDSKNHTYSLYGGKVSALTSEAVYLKKGTYYVRVKNYINALYVPYKVSFTAEKLAIKKPSITKVTVKKAKSGDKYYLDSVKMKGNGDVQGFTLQAASDKKFKKKLVNKEIKLTDDICSKKEISTGKNSSSYTLSTGSKYYVRVRGYVADPFGSKIYGKYSKVKATK